jgi:hypothetical protein
MGLDLYADLLAEAAPLLLLCASLLCCKLVSYRFFFRGLMGLPPEVARKAAERTWHIAFGVYSLRATAVALSDLGLLHQSDLGMQSLTKCKSGGSGRALLLPSSRRVFATQIALCKSRKISNSWEKPKSSPTEKHNVLIHKS